MQKRDSKSFDSGSSFRSDIDDDINVYSASVVANDGKKLLPTPPIRSTAMASNQLVNDNNTNNESIKHNKDIKTNTTPSAAVGDSDNNKTDDNDINSGEQSQEPEHEHEHEHEHEVSIIMMILSCQPNISNEIFIYPSNCELRNDERNCLVDKVSFIDAALYMSSAL